ncbi:MAG: TonB-dependent receptor [Pseudomonadota bacterium]
MTTVTSRRVGWALVLAAALSGGPAQGQAAQQSDELDLLAQENLVYSAARYAQTIAATPANVSVISRADIRRYGYRSVQAALASLPGVFDAASQWPAQGVSGIAVPGDFGSRLLYLVNGMPIYEPTYGGFFLDYLDIDSIERIEFVKGPGSALYGSGAVLGLVNLITRGSHDPASSAAALELASHKSAKLFGSHQVHSKGRDLYLAASVASSRGRNIYLPEFDRPEFDQARYHGVAAGNDGARTARVFGRVARDGMWFQALAVSASKRDPLASYGSVFNARLALRESMAALEAGMARELGQGGLVTARAYLFDTAERGDYPYAISRSRGAQPDYINVSDLSSRQHGIELRYDRYFAHGHHVLAGVEAKQINYVHQVGDQPGMQRSGVLSVNMRSHYRQWAVFAQDEMRMGPGKLFIGARFDSYQGFSRGVSSRLSPRLAYVHDLASGPTFKIMYGEAYRAPTIYESRYQDGRPAASTIWENSDLRPERSQSLEAMLIGQTGDALEWRVAAFMKHLHETPVQVVTPAYQGVACGLGPDACIQYRNSKDRQQVHGIEFDIRLRDGDQGDLYASAVLQSGRNEFGRLTSSPRRQFKAGISRALPWRGADAALEAQYISAVPGRADNAFTARVRIDGYLLLNGVFNVALADGWRVSLRADNLLDRDYDTVASRELQPLLRVPADGRRAALQLQREF